MHDDGPNAFALIAAVAIIVALVILVFFALGYLVGRVFMSPGALGFLPS